MDKYTGIWIDLKEAIITTIKDGTESLSRINSEMEVGHVKGGSGSSTPYGPQDAVSESKYLEKRKQALKQFYDNVAQEIARSTMIFLLGPADVKNELFTFLKEKYEFSDTPIYIQTEDKLTDNQLKAKVREFFASRV